MKTTSIVFGVSGCLGSAIFLEMKKADSGLVIGACRNPNKNQIYFDLGDPTTWTLPDKIRYGVIAAAATNRKFCENYPYESEIINVVNTKRLALSIAERGGRVLFLSTNLVFDGSRPEFMPWDPVDPIDNYGMQKAKVEEFLLNKIPSALIIRLTKVLHNNFPLFETWIKQLINQKIIKAFKNIHISPISPNFVAKKSVSLLLNGINGIVHLSGNNSISYLTLALMLLKYYDLPTTLIHPIANEKPFLHGTLGTVSNEYESMVQDSISVINSALYATHQKLQHWHG